MRGKKSSATQTGTGLRGRRALRWIPVLLLLLAACRVQEPPAPPPAAMVNGEPIGAEEFLQRLEEHAALLNGKAVLKPEQKSSLKEEVLSRLIEERLVLHRARALSLAVGEAETETRIGDIRKDYGEDNFGALFGDGGIDYADWKRSLQRRMLLEKVIDREVNAKIQVTDAEAEQYFKTNRKRYVFAQRVRVTQIVIRDRDRAEGILKRLKAGEDFGKVARELSIGPEADRGGDLGFFERGTMPEAIDRVVFSLPVGKLSRVVRSPYGYHIFKVLEKDDAKRQGFAEMRERVRADVWKLKEAQAYERWIEDLKEKADIRISRPLPDGPLPATVKKPPPAGPGEP
ncbi:MAG: peptidylprolyl isomerase [Thermodesulfobacteriota bacterium]